jgi:chromosome segregation ATPase
VNVSTEPQVNQEAADLQRKLGEAANNAVVTELSGQRDAIGARAANLAQQVAMANEMIKHQQEQLKGVQAENVRLLNANEKLNEQVQKLLKERAAVAAKVDAIPLYEVRGEPGPDDL